VGRRGQSPVQVRLTASEPKLLKWWVRTPTAPYRQVLRAKVVLLAAAGHRNAHIAQRLQVTGNTVRKWRRRFRRGAPLDHPRAAPGRAAAAGHSRRPGGRAGRGLLTRRSAGRATRTVDRLLAELNQERDPRGRRGAGDEPLLDARTVLVVDEAGMVGSRKLARLLDHTHHAGAKVVLVGDDRQLAAIEAGGGFRGLRLRLGVSELTENRRQQQTWEREAVEQLRDGDLDQALGAYRAHGRLVAAETPTQLKELLLGDWWQAFQHGDRVAILAHRREEVDQFNTACQQLKDHAGHLGRERLQVGDRSFAVGDLVVCGKNALRSLRVANGSRGKVLALDPQERSLTLRLDNGQEATLDGRYLDHRPAWWTRGNPTRRTIDLGYASTGHRSQGVTLDRALVRVAGAEDHQWLYVAAARQTTFFDVIVPQPRPVELELDVPQAQLHSIHEDLMAVGRRDGAKQLAVDTAAPLALRQMSKRQLRAERDRFAALLRDAPPDRRRLLAQARDHRASLRALELERPGWLRELGQPPASIKGQRAWRQAATHILQYRERYSITDPDHALGPEPRYADLEQRRHHRATRRVIERLRDRQRTQRDQQIGRRERAHPDQPRSRSSRTDRTCSARVDQRERGGREREAG
jgi:transposase-like protein